MSIVAILEVAIGMIFVWLIMSMAGMYIQEWIVSKLGWRAGMLETYIGNLVADPALARQFYDHPLIKGLHSGFDGETRPSYIPSAQFSMALFDIIRNAPKEAALIQKTLYELKNDISKLSKNKQALAQAQLDLALDLTRKAVASEGGSEITSAMLDEVKKQVRKLSTDFPALQPLIETKFLTFAAQKKQIDSILADLQAKNGSYTDESTLDQFKTGLAVMSVTHPDIKQAIEALFNGIEDFSEKTEDTLLKMRKNLEDWFNNSMDRLSGWYKRRAQTLALLIAISIAILLNVDSIQLATQLWRDPSVRQALTAQADALVSQNPDGFPSPNAEQLLTLKMQISQLNIPVGWVGTALPADSSGAVFIGEGTQKLCTITPQSSIELFGVFLGKQCYPIINTPQFNDLTGWLLKLIGLFITGVAAAQGAPFWFDVLKNMVNVRAAGVNSDAAASKSAK
jgi:hypothetical protein